jgi:hypothetical protein
MMGCDKLACYRIVRQLDIAMLLFVKGHQYSSHTMMEVSEINTANGGKLDASSLVTQDGGAMLFGDEIQPHASQVTFKNSASGKR